MNIITLLIVVNVISAFSIIALVLLQQGKGGVGGAFGGGGGSQSMFGSRGSANFLSRTTSIMCTLFFLTSLALAYSYAQRNEDGSIVERTMSVVDQAVQQDENTDPTLNLDESGLEGSVPDVDVDSPLQLDAQPDSAINENTDVDNQNVPDVPVN